MGERRCEGLSGVTRVLLRRSSVWMDLLHLSTLASWEIALEQSRTESSLTSAWLKAFLEEKTI